MKKQLSLFLTGGIIYPCLEIACRGFSDFSMAIAGGICLCLIDRICNCRLKFKPLVVKCAAGSAIITSVEFAIGVLVNLILKLNVWDYSQLPMNVMGQICVPFSLLWSLLTIPAMQLYELYDRLNQRPAGKIKE
ncbi:MAG: ABC-transporter type IV [Oscillospiraceae bacterium]